MEKNTLREKLYENRYALLLLLVIFAERIAVLCTLGLDYNLANDDMGYIGSGIRLATTGVLGIYSDQPSAMIMPGMPALLAVMTTVFGTETAYWLSVKLLWGLMGTCTAWVVYKSVKLFTPTWCALVAMAAFLSPNVAWMDNLIMTETPYFLMFTCGVYYTLQMGRSDEQKYLLGFILSIVLGLSLRPTIIALPVFSWLYLWLLKKKPFLQLVKRGILLLLAMLVLIAPWTARNNGQFGEFVPLTYGAGNPLLLGTYQGYGYPDDAELDLETNVEQVWRETYADELDDSGKVLDPRQEQRLTLEKDRIHAEYRMEVWWDTNPLSMVLSYLLIKPAAMVIKAFYWVELFGVPRWAIEAVRLGDFVLCCAAVILALRRREHRAELGFLAITYWGFIYAMSMAYSFSRYGETIMCLRYIMVGIGLSLLCKTYREKKKNKG